MNSTKTTQVLIADDDAEMRNLLASILRSYGYINIEFASDGQKALEALETKFSRIGIAFLDINMPQLSGIDVMKQAKVVKPDCFCVIITGQSDMDTVRSALESGARGFVVKPFSAKKIVDLLVRYERETGAAA